MEVAATQNGIAQRIDLYTESAEVRSLAGYWSERRMSQGSPCLQPEWIACAAESLLGEARLCMPVVAHGDIPLALAPLVRPKGLFRPLQLLGVDDHSEPCDFLYRDEDALAALAAYAARSGWPLFLQRLPGSSSAGPVLEAAYAGKALILRRRKEGLPHIKLGNGAVPASADLPARLKSDLRRAARKAAALGEVSFETHAPESPERLESLWREALEVEARSWKGRENSALARDGRLRLFYRAYAEQACRKGQLRIFFMRIAGRAVAMQLAVECADALWLLKIGYDEEYAKASPGLLLIQHSLNHAADRGLRSYEFLGDAAPWTRRWTSDEGGSLCLRIYPYTLRGASTLACDAGRALGRRLVRFRRRFPALRVGRKA